MEGLTLLNPEIEQVRWVIEIPHNTATKLYYIAGYEPDLRFGAGCLHKAFWVRDTLGGEIFWDESRMHFGNVLPDGKYFDASCTMRTSIWKGVSRTLDRYNNLRIQVIPGRSGRFFEVRPFTDNWSGRGFNMIPFEGSYEDGLNGLSENFYPNEVTTITWLCENELSRLDYNPTTDSFEYNETDKIETSMYVSGAARYCNANVEELKAYFRGAYELHREYLNYQAI